MSEKYKKTMVFDSVLPSGLLRSRCTFANTTTSPSVYTTRFAGNAAGICQCSTFRQLHSVFFHVCGQGNGQEEVVCCSWDGQTYIVNHSREVVRYHFKENVAAFTTGEIFIL